VASLAASADTSAAALVEAARAFNEERSWGDADPFTEMPRLLFAQFGATVEDLSFHEACYFHGTRVADPSRFLREGVRPLGSHADDLWAALYELVADVATISEWQALRESVEQGESRADSGWYYRNRIGSRDQHGPYAYVVRECHLKPEPNGWHDYLACPETVMDIARCFEARSGVDLGARFRAATVPCIVKFRSDELKSGAICAASWYVYGRVRDGELSPNSSYGPRGHGDSVLSADVLGVEIMEQRSHGGWAPAELRAS
jgi:hypothetical protein